MKAAVFKNLGQPLQIEKVPDPTPEATELVVHVAYCGICGTDLHSTREGAFAESAIRYSATNFAARLPR